MSRFVTVLVLSLVPATAVAQDGPIDIDFGSTRIGGTGVGQSERRAHDAQYEEDELPTAENIPEEGNKKRLPHLHVLAKRHGAGKQYKEACNWYDQIIKESGVEGLDTAEGAKKLAAKSYLECGEMAANSNKHDEAERLLIKSERLYGQGDYRHEAVRRSMLLEQYKKKLRNRDIDGALALFDKYQQIKEDEDERIALGEQLVSMADQAYKAKDKVEMERMFGYAEKVAPQNPKLRRMKEKLHAEEVAIGRAFIAGVAAVLLAVIVGIIGRWRGRKRIESLVGGKVGGKKNKFIDD